jgi:hypothetical protein
MEYLEAKTIAGIQVVYGLWFHYFLIDYQLV